MSTIIDALKKTQSAIDKKPYPDHAIHGDIEIPNYGTQNTKAHASLLGQNPSSRFSTNRFKNPFSSFNFNFRNPFSFSRRRFKKSFHSLNRRHAIGSMILLCLCGGIWLGYRYDNQITTGITKAASTITSGIQKHTPTTLVAPTRTKLTLNGTVHVGSNRDALINNQMYRVGDTVDGYKILEIRYDQVTLLDTTTQKTTLLTTDIS